jgi:hypothetical protein
MFHKFSIRAKVNMFMFGELHLCYECDMKSHIIIEGTLLMV